MDKEKRKREFIEDDEFFSKKTKNLNEKDLEELFEKILSENNEENKFSRMLAIFNGFDVREDQVEAKNYFSEILEMIYKSPYLYNLINLSNIEIGFVVSNISGFFEDRKKFKNEVLDKILKLQKQHETKLNQLNNELAITKKLSASKNEELNNCLIDMSTLQTQINGNSLQFSDIIQQSEFNLNSCNTQLEENKKIFDDAYQVLKSEYGTYISNTKNKMSEMEAKNEECTQNNNKNIKLLSEKANCENEKSECIRKTRELESENKIKNAEIENINYKLTNESEVKDICESDLKACKNTNLEQEFKITNQHEKIEGLKKYLEPLEKYEKELGIANKSLQSQKHDISLLEIKNKDCETDRKMNNTKLGTFANELDEQKKIYDTQRKILDQTTEKLSQCTNKILTEKRDNSKEINEKVVERTKILEDQKTECEIKLFNTEKRNFGLATDITKLKVKIDDCDKSKQKCYGENDKLEGNINKLKGEIEKNEKMNKELIEKYAVITQAENKLNLECTSENNKIKLLLEEKINDINEYKEKWNIYSEKYEQNKRQIDYFNNQIDNLKKEKVTFDEQINQFKKEKEEMMTQQKKELETLNIENKKRMDEINKKINELEGENTKLKFDMVENELAYKADLKRIQDELDITNKSLKANKDKTVELERKLLDMTTMFTNKQQEFTKKCENEKKEITDNFTMKEDNNKILYNGAIEMSLKELKIINDELDKKNKESDQLAATNKKLAEDIVKTNSDYQKGENKILNIEKTLKEQNEKCVIDKNEAKLAFEKEKEQIESEYKEADLSKGKMIADLSKEIQNLKAINTELEERKKESKKCALDLADLKIKLDENLSKLTILENANAQCANEKEQLFVEKSSNAITINNHLKTIEKQQKFNVVCESSLGVIKSVYEDQIEVLNTKAKELQDTIDAKILVIGEREQEIKKNTKKYNDAIEVCMLEKSHLDILNNENSSEIKKLEKAVFEKQKKINELNYTVSRSNTNLNNKNFDMKDLETKYKLLDEEAYRLSTACTEIVTRHQNTIIKKNKFIEENCKDGVYKDKYTACRSNIDILAKKTVECKNDLEEMIVDKRHQKKTNSLLVLLGKKRLSSNLIL